MVSRASHALSVEHPMVRFVAHSCRWSADPEGKYRAQVEEGKTYFWCSCGKSKNQVMTDAYTLSS